MAIIGSLRLHWISHELTLHCRSTQVSARLHWRSLEQNSASHSGRLYALRGDAGNSTHYYQDTTSVEYLDEQSGWSQYPISLGYADDSFAAAVLGDINGRFGMSTKH